MKKFVFGGIAIVAIAAAIAINVNVSSKGEALSDISLANVEALATKPCYGMCNSWNPNAGGCGTACDCYYYQGYCTSYC